MRRLKVERVLITFVLLASLFALGKNLQRKNARIALGNAVEAGDIAKVRSLLENGVSPNIDHAYASGKLKDRAFPLLFVAVVRDDLPIIDLLLQRGAKPSEVALLAAISLDRLGAAKRLLEAGANASASLRGAFGFDRPSVNEAVHHKNRDMVRLLVEHKAQVDTPEGFSGMTPLMIAADMGDIEMAKLLVESGASVNMRHNYQGTSLDCAIQRKNLAMAKRLVEWGADVNMIGIEGRTPLLTAVACNDLPMVQFLLSKGVKRNVETHKGDTALKLAEKHPTLLKALKDAGVTL